MAFVSFSFFFSPERCSLPTFLCVFQSIVFFFFLKLLNADIREVLQNEFRYNFRKGPREISASTVITVLKAIMHVNTVNTVRAEISRGPFRESYRNSFCKTSLMSACINGFVWGSLDQVASAEPSEQKVAGLILDDQRLFEPLAHVRRQSLAVWPPM